MLRCLVDRADSLNESKRLLILHFNDVYDITQGAASKFATRVKAYSASDPLVLFSGDCYAPSLMSVVTKGAQMPPVLNAIGVQAACFGNHEFDHGVPRAEELCAQCAFPWLISNCWVKATGKTLGDGERTVLINHGGVMVGLMGLIEREWLGTLSTIEESELDYTDYVITAKELCSELRGRGAEVVIALTHMRMPNDERLMRECVGAGMLDLILGGHDHDSSHLAAAGESMPRMIKSGTDFRELSEVVLAVGGGQGADAVRAKGAEGNGESAAGEGAAVAEASRAGAAGVGATQASAVQVVSARLIEVSPETPCDEATEEIVKSFECLVGKKMETIVGATAVPLDARFKTIRSEESNVGNCAPLPLASRSHTHRIASPRPASPPLPSPRLASLAPYGSLLAATTCSCHPPRLLLVHSLLSSHPSLGRTTAQGSPTSSAKAPVPTSRC